MNIEWIAYAATVFGLLAFLPQVIKAWKTKETKDISLGMYIVFWIGVSLWLVYGILIGRMPVIIINAVVLMFASTILVLKLRFG